MATMIFLGLSQSFGSRVAFVVGLSFAIVFSRNEFNVALRGRDRD
jgi:hypothetical protein